MAEENVEPQVEEETPVEEETTEEQVAEETKEEAEEATPEESEDDSVSISKAELTKLKRKAIAYDSNKTAKPVPKIFNDPERLERIELRQEGYSKDEIDEIMALGGTKVLDSKIVQSAIKTMRAEKKSKDASEPLSSKSPVYKKFTQDDLSKMSSKEMEKILRE